MERLREGRVPCGGPLMVGPLMGAHPITLVITSCFLRSQPTYSKFHLNYDSGVSVDCFGDWGQVLSFTET